MASRSHLGRDGHVRLAVAVKGAGKAWLDRDAFGRVCAEAGVADADYCDGLFLLFAGPHAQGETGQRFGCCRARAERRRGAGKQRLAVRARELILYVAMIDEPLRWSKIENCFSIFHSVEQGALTRDEFCETLECAMRNMRRLECVLPGLCYDPSAWSDRAREARSRLYEKCIALSARQLASAQAATDRIWQRLDGNGELLRFDVFAERFDRRDFRDALNSLVVIAQYLPDTLVRHATDTADARPELEQDDSEPYSTSMLDDFGSCTHGDDEFTSSWA